MNITERIVKGLRAPAEGQTIVWDNEIKGFGVRITAAGVIGFVLDYRIFGRQKRYTIGRWPELSATAARNGIVDEAGEVQLPGAIQLLQQIRSGSDPMEQRQRLRKEATFGDLLDDYLESDEFSKKRPTTQESTDA